MGDRRGQKLRSTIQFLAERGVQSTVVADQVGRLTSVERELNIRSLAARFAAKEAVAKALGAPAGMNWQHCSIEVDAAGAPHVVATGSVAEVADAKGVKRWHLSLSHDGDVATAMVVAEG